tara:strand:+ start:510 stop:701 length:192 start_codon:yes stop_codon:yes gene_type:complete
MRILRLGGKMKLPEQKNTGIGTAGAAGIALMILHITGYLTGWAWPLLYIFLILVGMGMENKKK